LGRASQQGLIYQRIYIAKCGVGCRQAGGEFWLFQ